MVVTSLFKDTANDKKFHKDVISLSLDACMSKTMNSYPDEGDFQNLICDMNILSEFKETLLNI